MSSLLGRPMPRLPAPPADLCSGLLPTGLAPASSLPMAHKQQQTGMNASRHAAALRRPAVLLDGGAAGERWAVTPGCRAPAAPSMPMCHPAPMPPASMQRLDGRGSPRRPQSWPL